MAIHGYVRVSTNRQDVENQKFQLLKFANEQGLKIDQWTEEQVSTRKALDQRELSRLIAQLKPGDTVILTEISRLARSMFEVCGILNELLKRDVRVLTLKERYKLGADINSKVLAFAFGLAAEIERNLISLRTREALERRKAEGHRLGRPVGSVNKTTLLTGRETAVSELLSKQVPIATAARILNVHRGTLGRFIKNSAQKFK